MMDPVGEANHHSKINSSELNLKCIKIFLPLAVFKNWCFETWLSQGGTHSSIHLRSDYIASSSVTQGGMGTEDKAASQRTPESHVVHPGTSESLLT